MKKTLALAGRFLLLVVVYFICFSGLAGLMLPPAGPISPAESAVILQVSLLVCLLNSIVIGYLVLGSRWSGWKLAGALAFVLFGVVTFMSQIETAVFVRNLPPGFLPRFVAFGLVFALVIAPLAVLILGKRRGPGPHDDSPQPQLTTTQWITKLSLIAIVYVFLYFSFGYFIAWRNPAVRAYYGGEDPGSFFSQMLSVVRNTPWLVPLQILRGLLWTAFAIPIIRMMKGHWWNAALGVALTFSVVMNSQLLLPNPLMPYEVRMSHLLETATSNFIFAIVLVWLLTGSAGVPPARDNGRAPSESAYLPTDVLR
jgi:hypothetical protein